MARLSLAALALLCAAANLSCGALADAAGVVTARTVAGTHTGVLEGITIASKDDLNHKDKRVIVDVDILHEVVIEQTGEFEVTISSSILPPIRAIILGAGPVALDLKVVDVELSSSPDDRHLKAVEVDQLIFVQQEGEWVLVLQMSRTGLAPEEGSAVNAYQYVSYPSAIAQQMSRDQAIRYVDAVLDLASQTQRM
ncbi:MAG: hypothetical protein HY901_11015 [Deltaproteobacteria bacterium]|nr:hypothetical protein [Deltaproteobacteria bacterium]